MRGIFLFLSHCTLILPHLSSPTQQAGDHTRPVVEFHIMGALPDGRRTVVLRT
jgi:hypothetical protein